MNPTPVIGAVAIVGACAVMWQSLASRPSRAHANLFAALPEPEVSEKRSTAATRRVGQLLRRFLPRPLVAGLESKLVQAGHPYNLDLPRVLGMKAMIAVAMALFWLALSQPMLAVVFGSLGFFLPDLWITTQRNKRQDSMRSAAADIIDQLTICVEAGLGFDAALNRVATTNTGPFAEELAHTIQDMVAGVPRDQALRAMADRAQVPEIRSLVTALIQSQKHGVSIGDTLRIQAHEMRIKRKQLVEEKAAKLTVKMIFPIVVCFLPVFFIIVAVPAVANIFKAL